MLSRRNPQLNKHGELIHLLSIEGLPRAVLTHILDTASTFLAVNDRASCPYMKMITPAALLRSLRDGADEVHVDPDVAAAARLSVQRMIEIGQPGGGE